MRSTLLATSAPSVQVGYGAIAALVLFILGSTWIGMLANRAMQKGSFLRGFFLGNRGLGSWALALTATVQSGGTFMGFPSLVYTHGWIVALWIASYMVVPITGFGVLGKRLAQLSRKLSAITVPDLFRERFASPCVGMLASLMILFYLSFMMIAQFKAGALVMKLAWPASSNLALSEEARPPRISAAILERLERDGVPPDTIAKLRPLMEKTFASAEEFESALKAALSTSEYQLAHEKIAATAAWDWLFLFGLVIFTITVVGYTLLGGFLAAVWTDLFQSVMMLIGVLVLLFLALGAVGQLQSRDAAPAASSQGVLEYATRKAVANTSPQFVFGPGHKSKPDAKDFLPLGVAVAFFFQWVFSGIGSPASMVRIMASNSTDTIRRSIYLLSFYNLLIYIPLIVICICGRALIPNLRDTDEIVPRMALTTTQSWTGGSLVAGLILAAPFGAVMATVSSYLVVISSGMVRDIYQRFIHPQANEYELKRLSYICMVVVGAVAVAANIKPTSYLQAFVVFSGSGGAVTFCVPALMACYWRRATAAGAIASMLAGAGTLLLLYGIGLTDSGWRNIRPYALLGVDPIVWGLLTSLIAGVAISLVTPPPPQALVSKLFDAQPAGPAEAVPART